MRSPSSPLPDARCWTTNRFSRRPSKGIQMAQPSKMRIHMTTSRILMVALLIVVAIFGLQIALAQQPAVKRIDLQRHDLSVPGRETIQAIVEIAPGQIAPRHTHPGEEIIYVLEGQLEYALDGKPPVTLKAGDVLFIPYGTVHSAKNIGGGRGAELATYVVEKGKPLVVAAD